jgi:hypothetical protein
MGLFNFDTGNAQANAGVNSLANGLFDKAASKILGVTPTGAPSPQAVANIQRPPVQGIPSQAPQVQPGTTAVWWKLPAVWIAAALGVVALAWASKRKG